MKVVKRKQKKIIYIIVAFLIVLILLAVIFILNVRQKNYFFYENKDYSKDITKEEVQKSKLIIINDVVVGAQYENKWISVKDIYTMLDNKKDISIEMYDKTRKLGTYETSSLLYNAKSNILYTMTTKSPSPKEYIAFSSDANTTSRNPFMKDSVVTKKDIREIKQALR